MMRGDYPKRAENYTGMALAMGLVNLLWIMGAVWIWFGLLPALLLALALNHLITFIDLRVTESRNRYAPQNRPFDPSTHPSLKRGSR